MLFPFMKIVPAILTDDPQDLELKIRQTEAFSDIAQIDIMDGIFVPSKSITASDLAKIKTKLFLEAHLMVEKPIPEIIPFKEAGIKRIIFHFESQDNPQEAIALIHKEGLEVGLAINPGTEISQISNFLDRIDLLLLMAVNPGFYGSRFIPAVLEKARRLCAKKGNYLLGLDGGVKAENIRKIKSAGIEIVYVGSGIFGKGIPEENFFLFLEKIKEV
ncbi:MAG: ribulose-phosphate 3-epimerase [Candidatus Omnitrophica bacterium]|nr:ribulose-phosphate 3-epimerase [Candidatus Omnitrophota bacterium]MCM8793882.1 ribulose-phosphate 3-epimerase [Candidatus Omnitrophota bacterium]